jgi:hypothetical protein
MRKCPLFVAALFMMFNLSAKNIVLENPYLKIATGIYCKYLRQGKEHGISCPKPECAANEYPLPGTDRAGFPHTTKE